MLGTGGLVIIAVATAVFALVGFIVSLFMDRP